MQINARLVFWKSFENNRFWLIIIIIENESAVQGWEWEHHQSVDPQPHKKNMGGRKS